MYFRFHLPRRLKLSCLLASLEILFYLISLV